MSSSGTDPTDAGSESSGRITAIGADGSVSLAPNGYYVMGNQVLDAAGHAHLFRGLDRPSLEWSSGGDNLSETDYQTMAMTWKANVVRIPLNQDFWLSDAANGNYDPNYAFIVDTQVMLAEKYGMDVILDLHWSDQGDYSQAAACLKGGSGCQQCMADAHSVLFWQEVAQKYAGDGHVLFELYNEPHDVGWFTWLNGGTSGASCKQNGGSDFTVHGMQELYDTVRAAGANNLVIVGGLNWAYDLTGVPSSRVKGYNIIYNSHPYAYKCGQAQQCSTAQFDQNFGFLAATDPVIATEFGDSNCSAGFYQEFTAYAQTNGIHWTGWAYYYPGASNVCGFPALISDWSGTPVPGSGTTVLSALTGGDAGM